MAVFKDYAQYYDLLYRDKDYASECAYICHWIRQFAPEARSLLNLGCGTGKHDFLLAGEGFDITGVDMSAQMISIAQERVAASKLNHPPLFQCGDVRAVQINRSFDVVTALFHVLSYQNSNDDVLQMFDVVKSHLKPGGLFIFDVWYGPAVLCEQPSERTKIMENDILIVERHAKPELHWNHNVVDVNYDVTIRYKKDSAVNRFTECHSMRYFFLPELDWMLRGHGFERLTGEEFMTGKELGCKSWSAFIVAKLGS